ncbi:MAG TPA: hypothetical protein VGK30_15085 [Candidatus Binatia bacterium]|jgi:hypothetical protein
MRWDWKVLLGVVGAAVVAGWFLTRTVHEPEIDFDAIDRDLSDLSAALHADAVDPAQLVPRVSAGIRFPSTLQYRRASDFWGPAVGRMGRIGRAGRKGRR